MPRQRRPTAGGEQSETVIKPRRNLLNRQHLDSGRRQFNRQGNSVEAQAELGDRACIVGGEPETGPDCGGSLNKQANTFGSIEHLDRRDLARIGQRE